MDFDKFTRAFRSRVELVASISVARVRPRTSKGITDLLLPHTSIVFVTIVPLRSQQSAKSESDYLAG